MKKDRVCFLGDYSLYEEMRTGLMNWNEETDVEIPFCQDLEKTGW